jgi:alkylated DNA repair dioxygenase AlkB
MKDFNLTKKFLVPELTEALFDHLLHDIKWHKELTKEDGEKVTLSRMMAYVAEKGVNVYRYANLSFPAQSWSDLLLAVKGEVEKGTGVKYNSVLLNYYPNGKAQIGWHSDKEESLGENPVIACINLGATRKFWFRKKENMSEKEFLEVEDGDLLVMGPDCQKNYLHAILRQNEIKMPRISLTFRYNY